MRRLTEGIRMRLPRLEVQSIVSAVDRSGPWRTLRSRKLILALKVFCVAMVLIAAARGVNGLELRRLLASARPWNLFLSVLALVAALIINAHRWVIVTRDLGQPIGFAKAISAYFKSTFFSQVLPTSIGGDAARVGYAIADGVVPARATIGVLIDRALGLCAVAVCLLPAGTAIFPAFAGSPSLHLLSIASVALLTGAALAALLGSRMRADRVPAWASAPADLLRSFGGVLVSKSAPTLVLDLVASSGLTLLSFMLCAAAVSVSLTPAEALIVMQGMTIASIIPASIGGWGMREGAAVLLFASLGVEASQALAISVLFGLSIMALGAIGGALLLVPRSWPLSPPGDQSEPAC